MIGEKLIGLWGKGVSLEQEEQIYLVSPQLQSGGREWEDHGISREMWKSTKEKPLEEAAILPSWEWSKDQCCSEQAQSQT